MRYRTVSMIFATLCIAASPAFCDNYSLQDWDIVLDGVNYYPGGGATLSSIPGLNASAYDSTTGLGTLVLTDATVSTDYFGGEFFTPLGVPDYNEYGTTEGVGDPNQAGLSYQIDVPEYDVAPSPNHGPGTIVDNLIAESLNYTNFISGTESNYLNDCGANSGGPGAIDTDCNDFVAAAQAFNYTVTAGNEEIVTLTFSATAPTSGFYVEEIHPVDGNNTSPIDLYFQASAVNVPIGPPSPVPEPTSWLLLVTLAAFLGLGMRKRVAQR
jgi:hypothetical protein